MLNKLVSGKRMELERLRRLREENRLPELASARAPGFARAMEACPGTAVIAEYKRASPSKGIIREDIAPEKAGEVFALAGASAISVLTEESHFQGETGFLSRMGRTGLPLLRKDFILDPLQVRHTASTPASAVLVIAAVFREAPEEMAAICRYARDLGLDPVVEITREAELDPARRAGARLIQVNNRDLVTLRVDREASRRLIRERDSMELWISASGIASPEDAAEVRGLGYDACLVGTSIMENRAPGAFLADLVRACGKKGGE
jgi:indole-3-glycerol phosphate synthase